MLIASNSITGQAAIDDANFDCMLVRNDNDTRMAAAAPSAVGAAINPVMGSYSMRCDAVSSTEGGARPRKELYSVLMPCSLFLTAISANMRGDAPCFLQ